MIMTRCPLRISLAGGSTDLDVFIEKFGYGSVISFPCNLYTYIYLQKDRMGYNNDGYYVVNYSEKEISKNVEDIKNEIAREALKYFSIDPIGVTFYSDIYSSGSGLASSSSYMNCLIKALMILKPNNDPQNYNICTIAHSVEKRFNHLLGQQDNYGCGIGGLKRMKFYNEKSPEINFINTKILEYTYMYLVPTRINRKSTDVLRSIKFDNDQLLHLVSEMENALLDNDHKSFHTIINEGWAKKKETSKLINENVKIKNLDKALASDTNILSHRLCGAGNGGFFLIFSRRKDFDSYDCIPISIDSQGITSNNF